MANERAEDLRDAIQEVLFLSKRWPRPRDEEEALSKAVQCIRGISDAELSISGKDTPAWLQSVKTATIQIVRTAPGDEWYPLAKILKQAQDELWGALPTQTGNAIRSHSDRNEIELDLPIVVWQPPFSFESAKIDAEFGLAGLFCTVEPLRSKVRQQHGSDTAAWDAYRAAIEQAGQRAGAGADKASLRTVAAFAPILDDLLPGLQKIVEWATWRAELARAGLYVTVPAAKELPPFDARELVDAVWNVVSTLSPDDYPPDPGRVSDPREAIKHLREVRRWCAAFRHAPRGEPSGNQPPAAPADDAAQAKARLLNVYTSGVSDKRIQQAGTILGNDKLTADEKLTKIDAIFRFPATTSAQSLATLLGVTKTAVQKTEWWKNNRKGKDEDQIERRRKVHRERAKQIDPDGSIELDE